MTSVAHDAIDLVTIVASLRDKESLQLVSRVLDSQVTLMQAQIAQMQQLQAALKERMKDTKG